MNEKKIPKNINIGGNFLEFLQSVQFSRWSPVCHFGLNHCIRIFLSVQFLKISSQKCGFFSILIIRYSLLFLSKKIGSSTSLVYLEILFSF